MIEREKNALAPTKKPEDNELDNTLRPQTFDEYVGQTKLKENLSIFIQAAKKRKEPIEHVLLHGPAGLGKTTLAYIIAREMNANIRVTSGPAIERAGDLASLLTNLKEHDILFIDEIHRLNRVVEEVMYPAMEDFGLDLIVGKGAGARSMRLNLPKFTIIGATTRAGLLSSPLRDRFGASYRLDFYKDDDIKQIIHRSSSILQVKVDPGGYDEIAACARKTPRTANRLLKRVRDFAEVKSDGVITQNIAQRALHMLGIDKRGLDEIDRSILQTIIEKFNGGPCGINAIAASTAEDQQTIEDVYEPFLLQAGFIARTRLGRIATKTAYKHLGLTPPVNHINSNQKTLL